GCAQIDGRTGIEISDRLLIPVQFGLWRERRRPYGDERRNRLEVVACDRIIEKGGVIILSAWLGYEDRAILLQEQRVLLVGGFTQDGGRCRLVKCFRQLHKRIAIFYLVQDARQGDRHLGLEGSVLIRGGNRLRRDPYLHRQDPSRREGVSHLFFIQI